jgi:cation diffusion facilitator family transporter
MQAMASTKDGAAHEPGLSTSKLGLSINAFLAVIKIVTGVVGHSYALIADGIESTADILSSLVVWSGLRISAKPADINHPYGHGKAEPIAALIVSLMLLGAALVICIQSVHEIKTPHHAPAWFTLVVLIAVVLIKEALFRFTFRVGADIDSTAVKTDAWHHRSDALTSAAAFVGISIALTGGPGYESADDWAALAAAAVIAWNAFSFLRVAVAEIMDVAPSPELIRDVEQIALQVPGVRSTEKLRIRKVGLHLAMDLHVRVDGSISVRAGHEIAHSVKDHLLGSQHRIEDVTIHIEPSEACKS